MTHCPNGEVAAALESAAQPFTSRQGIPAEVPVMPTGDEPAESVLRFNTNTIFHVAAPAGSAKPYTSSCPVMLHAQSMSGFYLLVNKHLMARKPAQKLAVDKRRHHCEDTTWATGSRTRASGTRDQEWCMPQSHGNQPWCTSFWFRGRLCVVNGAGARWLLASVPPPHPRPPLS